MAGVDLVLFLILIFYSLYAIKETIALSYRSTLRLQIKGPGLKAGIVCMVGTPDGLGIGDNSVTVVIILRSPSTMTSIGTSAGELMNHFSTWCPGQLAIWPGDTGHVCCVLQANENYIL
jgi:hypothetical protein